MRCMAATRGLGRLQLCRRLVNHTITPRGQGRTARRYAGSIAAVRLLIYGPNIHTASIQIHIYIYICICIYK